MKNKQIGLIVIIALLSFVAGYSLGYCMVIKVVADVAENFIDIDYNMVYQALTQYKNNIAYMPNISNG